MLNRIWYIVGAQQTWQPIKSQMPWIVMNTLALIVFVTFLWKQTAVRVLTYTWYNWLLTKRLHHPVLPSRSSRPGNRNRSAGNAETWILDLCHADDKEGERNRNKRKNIWRHEQLTYLHSTNRSRIEPRHLSSLRRRCFWICCRITCSNCCIRNAGTHSWCSLCNRKGIVSFYLMPTLIQASSKRKRRPFYYDSNSI